MAKSKVRLFLAVIVLALSLAVLIWAFWPLVRESRVLPIPPADLQLPTPETFFPGLRMYF
ncbi:MAG: hypothetical protein GXP40_02785 [Chloroflexi bacterium]|nr:hypothetical protein [Chloroflexota bacterium]